MKATFKFLFLVSMAACAIASEPLRLPVTKDNSIVLVDGEWNENAGDKGQIRIKANQHIVAMAFDLSAIRGKLIKKATLVCVQGQDRISGVTISTIATQWDENRSNGLTAGAAGVTDWGYAGARFPAVCGGNSFTLVHRVESDIRDGNYHWDIAPDIIYAMSIGVADGIAIHEHDAEVSRNPTIFAREQSAKKPYLLVEFEESSKAEAFPKPPAKVAIGKPESESTSLSVLPTDGFAYEVLIDGQPLGRHNIPFVSGNSEQTILLRDLPESVRNDKQHEVTVTTLNRIGQRSEPAVIRGRIFQSAAIEKPQVAIALKQPSPIANLSVIPVTDKYDAGGKPVGVLPDDYRTHNSLFDGRKIRLVAAAGEVVGFQLLLRGEGEVSVKLTTEDRKARTDLYQAVYVPSKGRTIPDPLLPLPAMLSLKPTIDQCVVADIFVPFDAVAGLRKGKIAVSDGRSVPIEIEVLPYALPKKATFFCEMNGYGLPEHVDEYYALQQIAYDHRVHANILHYSHNTAAAGARKSNLDMRLRSGKRMDNKRYDDIAPNAREAYWDDFAEAFGPYLDGSLFKDGHRGPIPAPGFYLTFHESWPLNCRPYFNGNLDAFKAFDDPAYERTYDNIMKDFRRLAAGKGWNQAGFQVYFNNKGSLAETSKAPWILDEPASFWDYRALAFYRDLTHRSRIPTHEANQTSFSAAQLRFRIDISRPEFSRSQLNDVDDLWVVSASAFQSYRRLVMDRIANDGLNAWIYGSSNHVHESNRNIQAWALDAWQYGATGIVPWQTINKSGSALKEADQLGLFIFDKDAAGQPIIRHSMRLKAFREAQQLIEHLNLLKQRRGWSQDQMLRFIEQYVDLDARVDKINEADAGTTAYGRISPADVELLRLAITKL